nr:MAG TPA: Regulatory-associated protein of TOR 1,Eukaryotic, TOS, PROTEIN BINDING.0A [Caudoviricetes sp.]
MVEFFPPAWQCHPDTKRTYASMTRHSLWQFWRCPLP